MYVVHCGVGSQKIKWLADVAIHRYDPYFALDTGLAQEVRFENGVLLNIEGMISEELTDDLHVYVHLRGKQQFNQCLMVSLRGYCKGRGCSGQKEKTLKHLSSDHF